MGGCWCVNTGGAPGQGSPHPESCEMTDAASCLCWRWAEGPGGADSIAPAPPALEELASATRKASLLFFSLGYLRKSGWGHRSEVYPKHTSVKGRFCFVRAGSAGWEVGAGGGSLPQGRTVCVPLLACFGACTENVGKIGS